MSYVRAWLRLSDAVHSVMAATGCSQDQAQADICRAIAHQAVNIRGKLGKHEIRGNISNRILEGKDFAIPEDLKPTDFDWENSRPLLPWAVHYEVLRTPGRWALEWIELFRNDVVNVLRGPDAHGDAARAVSTKTDRTSKRRTKIERVKQRLHELFPPHGEPPTALTNKELCRLVGDKLKELGLPSVSDDTILRAAGRRRK